MPATPYIIAAAKPDNYEELLMTDTRNRAWRRFKNTINSGKGMGSAMIWKPEKNWKLLYTRSVKIARAKQLGFDYPRKSTAQLLQGEYSADE